MRWPRLPWFPRLDLRGVSDEALAAKDRAESARAEAEGRWPEVTELTDSLSAHLERNHFGERLEQSMQRRWRA